MHWKWQASTAAGLHCTVLHNKLFSFFSSCHDFALLLGSTFSITRGTFCGLPGVLFKVYGIVPNMMKKHTRTVRKSLSTAICNLLETGTSHAERISITQRFKQMLAAAELTAIATGGGREIIMLVQYVL